MTLVGAPSIGREAGDRKRRYERWPWEKHRICASPKAIRSHRPPGRINRMPEPPRLRFLANITPHLIEFGGQPAALIQLLSATELDLHLLWGQVLPGCLRYLVDVGHLFLSAFRTVVGLTGNTRAVSRMPLACIAMSTICCLPSGKRPAEVYARRNVRPRPRRHSRHR
jgi:hypothetical protein